VRVIPPLEVATKVSGVFVKSWLALPLLLAEALWPAAEPECMFSKFFMFARPPHIFVCLKLKSTILNFSKSYLKEFEWLVVSLNASRSLALNSRFFIQFLLAAIWSFVEPRGWIVLPLMYITEASIKEHLSSAVRPAL